MFKSRLSGLVVASGMVLGAGTAMAQMAPEAAPTTVPAGMVPPMMAPTTGPASAPTVDPNSPRGALVKFSDALNRGDGDAIRSVLRPTSPDETKMVEAIIRQTGAVSTFRKTLLATYGKEETDAITGDPDASTADQIAALATAPEKIDGDAASITLGQTELKLNRVGGIWTVPMSAILRDLPADKIGDQVDQIGMYVGVLSELTTEVKSKTYATAEDVGEAMKAKISLAAVLRRGEIAKKRAATQPAADPTTAPAKP